MRLTERFVLVMGGRGVALVGWVNTVNGGEKNHRGEGRGMGGGSENFWEKGFRLEDVKI